MPAARIGGLRFPCLIAEVPGLAVFRCLAGVIPGHVGGLLGQVGLFLGTLGGLLGALGPLPGLLGLRA